MKRPWLWVLALFLLTATGFALRFWPIASRPLWFDEASDWFTSARSAGIKYKQFFLWTNDFEAAPLMFLLRRLSMDVLGSEAEWAFRLPSLICSVLCIPMAFWLGRVIYSNASGLLLAAFMTFDPNMVDQGQQGRSYPLFVLLILAALAWSITLFRIHAPGTRVRPRDELAHWAGLGIILGLLFCTTQFGLAVWCGAFLAGGFLLAIGYFRGSAVPGTQQPTKASGGQRIVLGLAVTYLVAIAISSIGLWDLFTRDTQRAWGAAMTYPQIAREITVAATDIIQPTPPWLALHLGSSHHALPIPVALAFYPLAATGLWLLFKRCRPSAALIAGLALATILMLFPFRKTHHFMAPRYVTPIEPALWVGLTMLALAPGSRWRRCIGYAAVAVFLGAALFHSLWLDTWYTGSDTGKWLVGPQIIKLRGRELFGANAKEPVLYQPEVLEQVGRHYGLIADPTLNYAFYHVPRTPGERGKFTWQERPHIEVPVSFNAPATWLVIAMVDDPTRLHKAQTVVEALARHYGVKVDPGERDRHLQQHRAVLARFSRAGIEWQSVGVGEPDSIAVPPP